MIILQYHEICFRLTATRYPGMAAGAVSLRKSHDIVILSFCNMVKGRANYLLQYFHQYQYHSSFHSEHLMEFILNTAL